MKTSITAILMSAVFVLLASCSQGDDLSPAGGTADGLVPVTLSVAVAEDGAATRATTAGEDELPTRGFVQIFTTEDNGQTIVPAGGDLAGVKPMTSNGGGSFSLSGIYLNPNDTYVFLYWADNAASTAPTPDDMNGVPYTAGTIAFAHRSAPWNYTTSGNANISATLTHAVAKVTLKTTTDLEVGSSITVTLPTTYTTYDVATGAVAGNAASHDYSFTATSAITGTTDGTEVFSFYALVADELQTVTITNADENISSNVPNVPLAPNRHTTLVGDVRNVGMEEVTFTAGIDEDWGDGGTIHFMPHNINEGDVTIDGGQHYITGDGTETENTITITGDAKVYLENVNINSTDGSAISITGGNPTIHVRGKNTVTSSSLNLVDGSAGIYVAQGSSVTITGNDRNNDVLWAQTSINGAGIGGRGRFSEAQCGNITIENVTVYAYACIPRDMVFPGIGGYMTSGTIKIKDATVHTYGSTDVIGGQFPPTAIGASNVPVIIIEKSDIYAHRGTKHDNRNADYIGRSATGIYSGTEEIQYGTGGSITNTTVYCYTGTNTTTDKVVVYDADGIGTEQ